MATPAITKSALATTVAGYGSRPLAASDFQLLTGQFFVVEQGDIVTQLKLISVVVHPRSSNLPRNLPNPFSLIFSSPWHEDLPAQIYETDNAALGTIDMFITPVAQNLYEAPFN
jgi:hypothetical protein